MPADENAIKIPYVMEIETLDLGTEVRAVGLDLTEADENREPARGPEAARVWSRILPVVAGSEPWALDFFSHLDRVKEFCERHGIAFREATQRSMVIPAPKEEALEELLDRFQKETFGARAGGTLPEPDPALEGELAGRGADAYHTRFPKYFFCAVCAFEDGSLVLLSNRIGAGEVIRRVRPVLQGLDVTLKLDS
jgi:hypothetical protein